MSHRQNVKQYIAIDLAKFLCSLLVVVIHTSPLKDVSEPACFVLDNILARVAVPLFFAISGFLFFGKLDYYNGKISGSKDNLRRLLFYCKRNTALYLGWSAVYFAVVYLPMWYRTGWWGIHVVKDALICGYALSSMVSAGNDLCGAAAVCAAAFAPT
jgi:serine/alanine racemase